MAYKKEIIALLRKREGVQLSSARIEQIANVLDGEVVEETDIETAIETYNKYNPLAEIAKMDDKIRSLEKKPKPQTETEQEKAEREAAEKAKVPTDVPEYVQAILDGQKKLADKLAALEGSKVVSDRKKIALEKFADANETFRNDLLTDLDEIQFKDDDHFNSYIERKEKTFGELKKSEVLENLGTGKVIRGTAKKEGEEQQATKEELDNVMSNIKI
ncbi:MAG: hypothetical protein AAGB30_11010 [Pedobacter sp.]